VDFLDFCMSQPFWASGPVELRFCLGRKRSARLVVGHCTPTAQPVHHGHSALSADGLKPKISAQA
jgi:hypothetical protein